MDKELLKMCVWFVVALILLSVCAYFANKQICYEKTKRIGFQSEYTAFGGCMIEYKQNKWIPLENYKGNQD